MHICAFFPNQKSNNKLAYNQVYIIIYSFGVTVKVFANCKKTNNEIKSTVHLNFILFKVGNELKFPGITKSL